MISLNEDPLVLAGDYDLLSEPMYFKWGISPTSECWLRQSIARKLVAAQSALPSGLRFKIWDGFRTTDVQQRLYGGLYKKLAQKDPNRSDESLSEATREFVAAPTTDPLRAAPHNTGATVDLTLINSQGKELDMGTPFDHFSVEAHTFHYKNAAATTREALFHSNRMILYEALASLDFYNYPEEWWHFSYGDREWADHKGTMPLFASAESHLFSLSGDMGVLK